MFHCEGANNLSIFTTRYHTNYDSTLALLPEASWSHLIINRGWPKHFRQSGCSPDGYRPDLF
ncbi:hypothetical protein Cflav_PD2912 [Pedosphaera parvula Ellin514]|uniref:Uncharacterized protein n=1 Tax=Pedosphaera parvula (strain Ellin514) TaxID=320771 RepID=B9XML1_PEDPL|nr:hypothetical protein Cflav_PD2912 [Pedosphaera parvula Ellin514]